MANRELYVIRDRVADYAGPVFQARNEKDAVRQFFTALSQKGTTLNEHPADFELIKVAEQLEDTGELTNVTPVRITNGATWKEVTEQAQQMAVIH